MKLALIIIGIIVLSVISIIVISIVSTVYIISKACFKHIARK